MSLQSYDKDIYDLVNLELKRQCDHLEMIASENFTYPEVMEVMGSILTNKYAEGYPGKRYYGGCEFVDEIEQIAIDRCKELFGCEFANVQPNSGSQANQGVYGALLNPGDKILGMDLSHGGHLTHGAKVSSSGKMYESFFYGVELDGRINYDRVMDIAKIVKPKMIVCGASAYTREIEFKKFREIADAVGAILFADVAHIAGLGEILIKRGFDLVSGGTDNHLILMSFLNREFSGKDADIALGNAGITVNKNTVPGEIRSPFITSGIRVGSPALTARGMKEAEFELIANKIADVLSDINNISLQEKTKAELVELAHKFIIYDKATF